MPPLFGPAGNADAFPYKSSVDAPCWLKKIGLDCYEYQCGKGVNIREETARKLGEAARDAGIALSLHAPYFINLANPEPESLKKTIGYILSACQAADWMGATRIVVHIGALMKRTRREALDIALTSMGEVLKAWEGAGYSHIALCPETMGKLAQIGTLEEIVEFCKIDKCFLPAIDFGHINAREQGSLKTVSDYKSRLEYMIAELGFDRVKNFHVHFSKIMYGGKGEIKHLTFEDAEYGPEFEPLAVALKELKLEPYIVSESAGTQAEDALAMKRIYGNI